MTRAGSGVKFSPVRRLPGFASEDGVQFDRQDIAFDDFNIRLHVEFHPQLRR